MDVTVTNQLLSKMWATLREEVERDIETSLAGLSTTGNFSITLAEGQAAARFDGPPEVVTYDEPDGTNTASIAISLPARSSPAWSLSLRGSLSGSYKLLGQPVQLFQNRAFTMELKRLKLGITAGVAQLDTYPQLTSFGLSLDIELEVEGFLTIPGPWSPTTDGKAYETPVKVNLEWLIPGAPTIDGKLRATLTGDDFLTLIAEGIGPLPLGVKVPGAVKAIVAGMKTGNFPQRWGSGETQSLLNEDAPTAFTVTQMAAAANNFQVKQPLSSTPWGTVFDVIRHPTLRSGALVNADQFAKALASPDSSDPRAAISKYVWSQVKALDPALAQRLLTQNPIPAGDQAAFVTVLRNILGTRNLGISTYIDPLKKAALLSSEALDSLTVIGRGGVNNSPEAIRQMNEWIFDDAYQAFLGTPADGSADRYTGDRDSLIWTGHLLAAEAFHFAAVSAGAEQNATLQRIKDILAGIGLIFELPSSVSNSLRTHVGGGCLDLTPTDPDVFDGLICRSVVRTDQANRPVFDYANTPVATQNQYYPETPLNDGKRYLAFGRDDDPPSRDQALGAMLGLSACVKFVPDAAVQQKAGDLILAFHGYLEANGWSIPTPMGELFKAPRVPCRIGTFYLGQFIQELAILWAAAFVEAARGTPNGPLRQQYDEVAKGFGPLAWLPVWLDTWDPITHYFKFNLDHAAVLMLELLDAPNSPAARTIQILRQALGHHRNAYFNLVYLLSLPVAARQGDPSLYKPAPMTTAQETTLVLRQWLTRYNGVVGRRPTKGFGDLCLQLNPDSDFLKNLQPAKVSVQPVFGDDTAKQFLPHTALGAHMRPGRGMDFMWQRCSFDLGYVTEIKDNVLHFVRVDEGSPYTGSPGIDFQLAFWMGKWMNCLPSPPALQAASQPFSFFMPAGGAAPPDHADLRMIAEWLQRFDSFHQVLNSLQFPVKPRLSDFSRQKLKEIVGADPVNVQVIAHHAADVAHVTPDKAEAALKAHANHDILSVWSAIDLSLIALLRDSFILLAVGQAGTCQDIVGSLGGSEFGRRPTPEMFGNFSNVRALVSAINQIAQVSDPLPWGNIEAVAAGRVSDLVDAIAGRMHL